MITLTVIGDVSKGFALILSRSSSSEKGLLKDSWMVALGGSAEKEKT